jgi:DNA polymerase-1
VVKEEKPLLLLFDGNALVHRAFHALPPLTQHKTGELVNAVYGFASTLLKVFADFKPTHWAVAFDRPTGHARGVEKPDKKSPPVSGSLPYPRF